VITARACRRPRAARPSTARRPAGSCPDGRISSSPSPPSWPTPECLPA
jgi:hypothetical protein